MSWLGDIFGGGSSDSGGWEKVPSTKEQDAARAFLQSLYQNNIQFPTRNVPGLSDLEQQAQSLIQNYIGQGTPAGVTQAIGELSKTVAGGYNPETSAEYQGYRTTSQLEENAAVNALRRRLQLGGLPASTPALSQEGTVRQGYSGMRLQKLGDLIQQARNQQLAATIPLASLSTQVANQPLQYAQAAESFGAIPRGIETEQDQATWEALMNTLLAPYTYQAGPAGTILNEPRYTYINQPQTSSGTGGSMGNLAGSIIPQLFGGGGSAGGSSGGGSDSAQYAQLAMMLLMMA